MTDDPNAHGGDIAGQFTRRVEEFVDLIRDHSIRPLLTATSAVVAVVAGAVIAVGVLVAIGIGLTRLVDHDLFGGRIWAGDFLLGGILGLGGLFLLRMSSKARRNDVIA